MTKYRNPHSPYKRTAILRKFQFAAAAGRAINEGKNVKENLRLREDALREARRGVAFANSRAPHERITLEWLVAKLLGKK